MKKILFVLAMLMIINPVFAKNIKVEALSNFSTANPPKTWKLRILEGFVTDNGIVIHPNTIIVGVITDVVSPKKLKKDATFKFIPQYYYDQQDGINKPVKRNFVGKYSPMTDLNAKSITKKGVMTAGNILIGSFVAPTVGLVEGAVKNETGNRAKSAVVSAYENTPLSYASKGKDLEFKKGQVLIMNFKIKEETTQKNNQPNYTYEIINNK